jgi:hypothetical protein
MNDKNDLVTIATVSSSMEANIMKSKLESEGIPCFVADQNMININPLYSNALGGVRLQVRQSDIQEAQEILQLKIQSAVPDAPPCPRCGSKDITYSKLPGILNILSLLGLLFFLPGPRLKRHWICKKCRHPWRT